MEKIYLETMDLANTSAYVFHSTFINVFRLENAIFNPRALHF